MKAQIQFSTLVQIRVQFLPKKSPLLLNMIFSVCLLCGIHCGKCVSALFITFKVIFALNFVTKLVAGSSHLTQSLLLQRVPQYSYKVHQQYSQLPTKIFLQCTTIFHLQQYSYNRQQYSYYSPCSG